MIIGISPTEDMRRLREIQQVSEMIKAGLNLFHLRKPALDLNTLGSWMDAIEPALKERVSWHLPFHFHALGYVEGLKQAADFSLSHGLSRIHLPAWWWSKMPAFIDATELQACLRGYRAATDLKFSTSAHNLQEAVLLLANFDYVLLSPVLDSQSKPGYKANPVLLDSVKAMKEAWTADDSANRGKLIGLGGINIHNLGLIKSAGFDGAAMLGSIWAPEEPRQYIHYIKKCQCIWNG